MSAFKKTGKYIIGKEPMWDADLERWFVRIGTATKKGFDLHYTVHSKNPETLMERADILARLFSAAIPDKFYITDKTINDILNGPED